MGVEIDQSSKTTKKKTEILYVDDQPNRSILDRFKHFYDEKVAVEVATGLSSAIAETDKTSFDVIICDGNLTDGHTGLDLYDQIKNKFTGMFIMYSGDDAILKQAEVLGLITVSKIRPLSLFALLKEKEVL